MPVWFSHDAVLCTCQSAELLICFFYMDAEFPHPGKQSECDPALCIISISYLLLLLFLLVSPLGQRGREEQIAVTKMEECSILWQ